MHSAEDRTTVKSSRSQDHQERASMACGSLFAQETQLGRDLSALELTRADLTRADLTSQQPPRHHQFSRNTDRNRSGGSVHEAVRFLQAEHEKVLTGLHEQVQLLQQRCDDYQFDKHLRHVTLSSEETWRQRVAELTAKYEERTAQVAQLEQQHQYTLMQQEEEREQNRWREMQLQQQVEAREQKVSDLRNEMARLKAQVRDLKIYSTALRTQGGGSRRESRASVTRMNTSSNRPLSRSSRASVGSTDSLDSLGPRSLGSEDGEAGSWRGARLGGGGGASTHSAKLRSIRPSMNTAMSHPPTTSLPPSFASPQPPSLPPLASLQSPRPSSTSITTLPPITQSQSVTRQQVRRQLRLTSAPLLDVDRANPRTRREPA
ncbi:unnamed protein product [Meganyctiphanes norvegica]|uniref:CCDC92/74 N-terminal domain-containing protein n=1 Tax=Meganyctiphanes norvegica TaxID=48144 RepID=A0AAV2PIX5_MEGNR